VKTQRIGQHPYLGKTFSRRPPIDFFATPPYFENRDGARSMNQNHNSILTIVLFSLFGLFFISGCISTQSLSTESCDKVDWYELGRRDGARGVPVTTYEDRRQDCDLDIEASRKNLYINGHNAGLVDYCRPDNGYELGRTGQLYFYVCPGDVETDFLKPYRLGRKVYQLELANRQIDQNLSSLLEIVKKSDSDQSKMNQANQQIENLRAQRAENAKALEEIKRRL
jgi:hypothetical protein